MKQCENYEDALYTDCQFCDEYQCKYKKETSIFETMFFWIIIVSLILLLI